MIEGADLEPQVDTGDLVIAYGFDTLHAAEQFMDFAVANQGAKLDEENNAIFSVGADPGGDTADHWCPGRASRSAFRHRASARSTVNAGALVQGAATVNVVIIDQGLNKQAIQAINPQNWGGGLGPNSGLALRTSHGMMVARNILDLAPGAVLYDVPLIPPRITSIPAFISTAQVVYKILLVLIALLRLQPRWSGPWILVNAWSIYDRSTDLPPFGSYTENKHFGGHPMINLVTRAVQHSHLDVVFAAGNCGEFCPSQRCGGLDRGPGHSIWGANAHPLVITAGAVLTDETWLGYSSQGPGPVALATQKPDFCAPSQFCETNDASGTEFGNFCRLRNDCGRACGAAQQSGMGSIHRDAGDHEGGPDHVGPQDARPRLEREIGLRHSRCCQSDCPVAAVRLLAQPHSARRHRGIVSSAT